MDSVSANQVRIHCDGKYFVTMCSKGFNFSTKAGVPESDGSVLTPGKDVLGRALGVSGNIYWAFMSIEGDMDGAC